jgi:hypothetical protein
MLSAASQYFYYPCFFTFIGPTVSFPPKNTPHIYVPGHKYTHTRRPPPPPRPYTMKHRHTYTGVKVMVGASRFTTRLQSFLIIILFPFRQQHSILFEN